MNKKPPAVKITDHPLPSRYGARSQTNTVASPLPVAKKRLSDEKARDRACTRCPATRVNSRSLATPVHLVVAQGAVAMSSLLLRGTLTRAVLGDRPWLPH